MAEDLEVGMKCVKYMLFVANFMFVMIGFLLISIGSTIKAIYGDFDLFMESHYFSPATLAVAIGVIMFFVALFGCVGALKESTCLINLFALFLTFILILEIAASIAAYAMRGNMEGTIRDNMERTMQNYYNPENRYLRSSWDYTQDQLECCGVDKYTEWSQYFTTTPSIAHYQVKGEESSDSTTEMIEETTTVPATTVPPTTVPPTTVPPTTAPPTTVPPTTMKPTISPDVWLGPKSCCRHPYNHNDRECHIKSDVWKDGCLDSLTYIVSESALLLGCGALAVAFIQILGIVFALMLAKAVRRLKTQSLVEREQNRQRLYEQLARGNDEKSTPVLYTSPDVDV